METILESVCLPKNIHGLTLDTVNNGSEVPVFSVSVTLVTRIGLFEGMAQRVNSAYFKYSTLRR